MRNLVLGSLIVLSSAWLSADLSEKGGVLSSKVILEDSDGYFGLSDGSCWKAITFVKRWRSVSEWWSDVEIVPESYNCVPDNWVVGSEIEVYSKSSDLMVSEENASNQEALQACTHLLYNSQNDQILFAIALHPADALTQLCNDVRKEGYEEGYKKGDETGYRKGHDEGYKKGDEIGYRKGHDEGYKKGDDSGCRKGDDAGYKKGHDEGYNKGDDAGYKKGHDEGYKKGDDAGYKKGHDEGYKKGHDEGYNKGDDSGYRKGHDEGYNKGDDNGYKKGYDEGYKNGRQDLINQQNAHRLG